MGHESATTRRAQNQHDRQEQPTTLLPYHPACLTCFGPFAKKYHPNLFDGLSE
jgi:hypothetical protein